MTVGPGQFRLHIQADPALDAGTYRVDVTTDSDLGEIRADSSVVEITGPRLRLGPADVAATAPVDQASGDFAGDLPYVALTRKTLPWERSGPPAAAGVWMALLVTRESPAPEAVLATGPLSEAVNLPGVPPQTQVGLLRVNASGAPVVRAQLSGLAVRCHVREIDVRDTATMGTDDDGWQAVVVGCRLPQAADAPGVRYRATVVSVEGRTDLPPAAGTPVFLALYSWTFTSVTGGTTFARLVGERLTVDRFAGAAQLPAVDRDGRATTVRYRSPLQPAPRPAVEPDDVTARSAFELGRMLAAADGRLLRELVAWRQSRQRNATAAVTDAALIAALGPDGGRGPHALRAAVPTDRPAAGRAQRVFLATRGHLDPALPAADPFDLRRPS